MYRYFFVVALLVMSVLTTMAQDHTDVVNPDTAIVSDALLEHLSDLEQRAIDLRGLQPTDEVIRDFPDRDQLTDYVYNVIGAELTPDVVHKSNVMYRAMGFWDANFDLVETYLMLLNDQIAGFYDLETKIMHTVTSNGAALGDSLSILDRVVYVHEYTHFLQDQNYDLTTLQSNIPDTNTDESMAVLALIEGDATVTMTDFVTNLISENPLLAVGLLLTTMDTAMPEGVPEVMIAELTASYTLGENFVRSLIRQGGWDQVDEAFLNPPTSMMHIYYPQKYLDGVQPIEVGLTDGANVLGDDWTLTYETTLGIFYWREYGKSILGLTGINPLTSAWMGDYNHFYYNESEDQVAWSSRITWEDEISRTLFYQVIGEDAFKSDSADNDVLCGMVGLQFGCIKPIDERDLIYAVAPSIEQATALVELEG